MTKRDDFTEATKKAIASRAGWHCSFDGCPKMTVGPSNESPVATTMIGKAAHICGAASGRGSRRYNPAMTREQRRHISNAIWMCADHAELIDRDEADYTAEVLRAMKHRHEADVGRAVRTGKGMNLGCDILAIGPHVVCTGNVSHVSESSWTLDLHHSMLGDTHTIISFIDGFATSPSEDRYILSNVLGDGRVLSAAPSLQKRDDGYALTCPVLPRFPRIEAQKLGSRMASHPETNDVYIDEKGSIARVSGLDALPQCVQTLLSMQRGESSFYSTSGVRFFEYFEMFHGSAWLEKLLMLDVVRQISIPYTDRTSNINHLPIRCVERVCRVELLAEVPVNHRLPVRLDLDVKGVGRWQRDMSVYMPTKEQMENVEQMRLLNGSIWQQTPFP